MVDALTRGKSIKPLIKIPPQEVDVLPRVPKKRPLIETVDLTQFDTGAGLTENFDVVLRVPFVRIARLIVFHQWLGTTLDYEKFGLGGGDLDNGFQIGYGLPDQQDLMFSRPWEAGEGGITATADYMKYAFDTDVVVDSVGASKNVYFTSRLSFNKFVGDNEGLDMTDGNTLRITGPLIGDTDIGDFGTIFFWTFEGWGWGR